jgi:hypothetical protein
VSKRDIGASVRQRLLNQAHEQGRPFQELLQYFVMERFLYRLSKSQFRDSFILKGALLLTAWRAPQSRPTMDDFALVPGKAAQWKAFLRRSRFETDYANLDGVIRIVRGFAGRVLTAAVAEDGFQSLWKPGGPWIP